MGKGNQAGEYTVTPYRGGWALKDPSGKIVQTYPPNQKAHAVVKAMRLNGD